MIISMNATVCGGTNHGERLAVAGRWRDSQSVDRLAVHNNGARAYVGVTDNNWYRFLADRPEVTEVNFWQPSGAREFRVLAPGEPFFFKTHYSHNMLVGGGFFIGSARLRVSEAWELARRTGSPAWRRCGRGSAGTGGLRSGPARIR